MFRPFFAYKGNAVFFRALATDLTSGRQLGGYDSLRKIQFAKIHTHSREAARLRCFVVLGHPLRSLGDLRFSAFGADSKSDSDRECETGHVLMAPGQSREERGN